MTGNAQILDKIDRQLIDVISAGLEGNVNRIELIASTLSRIIKKEHPDLARQINNVLGEFSLKGQSAMRSIGAPPLPIDSDSKLEMATITPPDVNSFQMPVLPTGIQDRVYSFLEEREKLSLLLDNNLTPSNSILLTGQPGTGKTMLAKYIASKLNKNLVVLDLSTSISSLLGKTGHNLKQVLNYARQNSAVLLLDEFDAIAKRRDDSTDLGEIKRVVNMLLMELEDWPPSSLLIATTNHPELLDKAIWRRFDHVIDIPIPNDGERFQLLKAELAEFIDIQNFKIEFLQPIAKTLEGKSAADICRFSKNVKRRSILKGEDPLISCFHELEIITASKKIKADFCQIAKELLGDKITVRKIAEITGLSPAGVQHHLSKPK